MRASTKTRTGSPETAKIATRVAAKPEAVSVRPTKDAAKRLAIAPKGRLPVKRQRAALPEDMKTSTLHLRLKHGVKEEAAAVLADIGISVPEAIRVFLGRIIREGRFPFELEVPNAVTLRAMDEADQMSTARFQSAGEFFDDLEKGGRH